MKPNTAIAAHRGLHAATLAIALLLLATAPVADSGTEEGITAFEAGNFNKAYEELKPAAHEGNAEAQHRLGMLYFNGLHVEKNYEMARQWLYKAHANGHAGATSSLGLLYENGEGVESDPKRAFRLYKKSAKAGNPAGQANLGRAYRQGIGIERDYSAAATWFRRAANMNVAEAQAALAGLYAIGKGVPQDSDQALSLAAQAANNGSARGQSLYAVLLDREGKKRQAYQWHRKAAIQARPESMYSLGISLWKGEIVEQDRILGAAWLGLAAQLDSERAAKSLEKALEQLDEAQRKRTVQLAQKIGKDPESYAPRLSEKASNGFRSREQ